MGNKIITEKDYWICSSGCIPTQLQGTQTAVKRKSGENYITVRDTGTSSIMDFGCSKIMLLYALIAAAAAVMAALIIGTGGAALIAIGAVAGLAGAAFGGLVGGLICGQLMAGGRTWIGQKTNMKIIGTPTITGDHKMTCTAGGTIEFAPHIKHWTQAFASATAKYIGHLFEGMMAGAAIGLGAMALSGGAAALSSGGLRGLGQASLSFVRSMPRNFAMNIIESGWGVFMKSVGSRAFMGLGLRGVMGVQNTAATYGDTGTAGIGDFGEGLIAMETGAVQGVQNIATGQGTWQDYVGTVLMFSPVAKGKRDFEDSFRNTDAENTRSTDGETTRADDTESSRSEEEGNTRVRDAESESPTRPDKDGQAYEEGSNLNRITPESLNIKMLKNNPTLMSIFNRAVSKLANSRAKTNAYKRYIEARNKNFEGLSKNEIQALCEDAWSATRSKMTEVAKEDGIIIEGEIHHWNYPKYDNPADVLNPNQLTEPINRDTHQMIHEETTSNSSKPWEGPISQDHILNPEPFDLP